MSSSLAVQCYFLSWRGRVERYCTFLYACCLLALASAGVPARSLAHCLGDSGDYFPSVVGVRARGFNS